MNNCLYPKFLQSDGKFSLPSLGEQHLFENKTTAILIANKQDLILYHVTKF